MDLMEKQAIDANFYMKVALRFLVDYIPILFNQGLEYSKIKFYFSFFEYLE
jgi:hypothetical protein